MKSFSDQIAEETGKINAGLERLVRATAMSAFSMIIRQSPVDSGRFRGNWFASTNVPSSKVTDATDKNGSKTISDAVEVVSHVREWNSFLLTNNLPYADVIEYGGFGGIGATEKTIGGYSRQAPAGVVRVSMKIASDNLAKAKI